MRLVGIDARALTGGPAGLTTYVSALLARIEFLDPVQTAPRLNNLLWNHVCVPLAWYRRGWSAYHAAAYTAPLVGCRPLVLTVHDVSYLVNPDWYPYRLDALRRRFYLESLKRADRIIVPSDFSRAEVARLFPGHVSRVRRIYMGVSREFYADQDEAQRVRQELRLPERFLLHVGDIHTRRNVRLIARVAERLQLPLVLVGKTLRGGEEFQKWPLRFSGLKLAQLRGVYSAASVFVYASEYEGFGLPLLEAMACGLPVVATRTSCLPEVCGQGAVLVDPNEEALVDGVRRAVEETSSWRAAGLERAARFSWEKTAAETEEVYAEALGDPA